MTGGVSKIQRVVYGFMCVLLLFIALSSNVAAQTINEDDANSIYNDTVWYKGTGNSASSCSPGTPASSDSLPADIISAINKFKPDYEKASQASKVPWQMLAGLHYRETGLAASGSNLFQINNYSGPSDLLSQAIAAGKFLQQFSVPANLPNHRAPLQPTGTDPEEIKDTFYSYNGRASEYADQAEKLGFNKQTQPYEGSPYVMNEYDAKHKDMGIITHDNGGIDGIDTRFGAYTIYARLGGPSGAGSCSGAVGGNAVQTAINYAWPDYHSAPYCPEKPSYKQAIEAAASKGEYVGGTCTIDGTWVGVDCGAFVTRVMRDSGADPKYNQYEGNTISQQQYLDEQVAAGKYIRLSSVNGTSDLQPGDIAINSVHTYMYVGNQPAFHGNSASASFSSTGESWRAPMASNAYGFGGEFTWYRLKAGG
jgi:hypothetical protein